MTNCSLPESMRTVAAVLACVGALAAGACSAPAPSGGAAPPSAQAPTTTSAPPTTVTIDTVRVAERALDLPLAIPGELVPFQSVALYARVQGFVRTVAVDRGSDVRAGALLATLDAPELLAQRAEAEARLNAAQALVASAQARADADRATLDRLTAASATPGVVAGNDLALASKAADSSRAQAESARQNADAARQALAAVRDLESYLRVVAPFSGVISERTVHPGSLVGGATASAVPMFRLVDARHLRLVVAVPEAYTADIRVGADMTFTVAAYPGRTFTARLARLAHTLDTTTRTMAVELDVDNADSALAPGAYAQVRWPVRRTQPSLFVPSGSVASTTDRTFVIRVRDGKAEWVDVRVGLTSGSQVEVFGDLHANDEVAARGTDELRAGTPVAARAPRPPA